MRSASERAKNLNAHFQRQPPDSPGLVTAQHLFIVAATFVQAQQMRNEADYDTSKEWTKADANDQIASVSFAFESWRAIRDEPVAQAYLVSLLGKDRGRG